MILDNFFIPELAQSTSILNAATATANATRAVGEAKAGALEGNASLLRFDAEQYRSVGKDVFTNQVRRGLQRVGSAGSQYVAGGVTLTGSAGAVLGDIQRESQREAAAQRSQYEYSARRASMQADISAYQAGLERQAAEFQAQATLEQASQSRQEALYKYLAQNKQAYVRAQKTHPWSANAGTAKYTIDSFKAVANAAYETAGKSEKQGISYMLQSLTGKMWSGI